MITINNSEKGLLDFALYFYSNGNILISNRLNDNSFTDYKPITIDTRKNLSKFFSEIKNKEEAKYYVDGLIPRNIHYFERDRMAVIWTSKKQKVKHLFKNQHIKTGEYPVPNLIWCATKNKLYVYAYLEIDDKIELYQAPFLNVSENGSVCLGTLKFNFSDRDYEAIIKKIEYKFFNSYFTHTNTNNLIDGNIIDFYKNYRDKDIFPEKLLIKSKKTYDSLYSLVH